MSTRPAPDSRLAARSPRTRCRRIRGTVSAATRRARCRRDIKRRGRPRVRRDRRGRSVASRDGRSSRSRAEHSEVVPRSHYERVALCGRRRSAPSLRFSGRGRPFRGRHRRRVREPLRVSLAAVHGAAPPIYSRPHAPRSARTRQFEEQMKDLTQDSIVKNIVSMAAPIAAGMLFQTLYFLVDLYFVAAIGDDAVAGVGAAGTLMFIVMALTQVLGVGAVALIAQAVGRRDQVDANLVFNQSVLLAFVCAAV